MEIGHDGGEGVEAGLAQRHSIPEGSEHTPSRGEGLAIPVDPDEGEIRTGHKERPSMPTTSERCVDHYPRGSGRKRAELGLSIVPVGRLRMSDDTERAST